MPTVNIDGDASGAISACSAAQGAIDAIHGKTVNVDINVRQGGAGTAASAMREMSGLGDAADRAGRSARGMGDEFDRAGLHADRAGHSARGMGDHFDRAAGHASRTAEEAEKLERHLAAVDKIMQGGAPSSSGAAGGLRGMADDAERVRGSIGGIGADGGRSLGAVEAGAGRAARGLREVGGSSRDVSKLGEVVGGVGRALNSIPDMAMPSMRAIRGVGLAGGVAALGMGALTAAVAGVGLAGVGLDFAHNNQLMHAGKDAVKDFNKEFTAMKGATTAAGMPEMAGVASSMKGVGRELAQIGAANMGPVLHDVATLGNQATQAMQKLAPSIGPATQGLTSLAGAVLGAFGDSGPAVTSFANTVTQNAAGLQALMGGVINTAAGVGNALVAVGGGIGQFDSGVGSPSGKPPGSGAGSEVEKWMNAEGGRIGDWGRSTFGGKSISPLSAHPAGTDPFSPTTESTRGGSAPRAVAPGGFDPSKPFSGQVANDNAGTSFTTGTGEGAAPKPPPPAMRSLGNFGPGSGGPMTPSIAGRSPDAAKYDGMTGKQIYNQQYKDSTGSLPGQPMYSGLGPRGPGQSVGPMPSSTAGALGGGGSALPGLMSSMQAASSGGSAIGGALSKSIAQSAGSGGSETGQAATRHISKAVDMAAPAAAAGGSAVGGALGAGMAHGTTSSMSVVDTVIIKHSQHIIDIAAGALGVHSPSTEFDYLGRMTGTGFGQGYQSSMADSFGSMRSSMGSMTAKLGREGFGYDNMLGGDAPTISVRRAATTKADSDDAQAAQEAAAQTQTQAMQYSPAAMDRIARHNERAAQLAGERADRHQIAMANLGVKGYSDPRKAGPPAPAAGPSFWDKLNATGPRDGMGGLKSLFSQHGESMTQGVSVGIAKGTPAAQNRMSQFSKGMQNQHKKDHGIHSPSTVFADDGMNMAAGVGVGFAGGAPAATSVMSAAAAGMSAALQGPLSDYGLQAGYTYVQAFADGSSRELKKTDTQALREPDNLSPKAMSNLAAGGFLRAGSGASTWKTNSGGSSVVTLGGGPQTITVMVPGQDVVIGDQVIASIADRQIELMLNAATGTYDTL